MEPQLRGDGRRALHVAGDDDEKIVGDSAARDGRDEDLFISRMAAGQDHDPSAGAGKRKWARISSGRGNPRTDLSASSALMLPQTVIFSAGMLQLQETLPIDGVLHQEAVEAAEKRPQDDAENAVAAEGRVRDAAVDQQHGDAAAVQQR